MKVKTKIKAGDGDCVGEKCGPASLTPPPITTPVPAPPPGGGLKI
jgi:hypothetical protein